MSLKQLTIALFFVLFLTEAIFASNLNFTGSRGLFDTPGEPRLRYPITSKVILIGQDFLEFKWWNGSIRGSQFIFKIYKGYKMNADSLIYQQTLSADALSVKVKSELFEDGQIYTWSLVQVSLGGQKSDKSFNSFRVFKH